jgi:hypothetical protein
MKTNNGKFFHFALGARYGTATGYPTTEPGEYWLPRERARGRIGVELFETTGEAVAKATANLEAMAAAEGLTVAQMRDKLIAGHDPARAPERRYAVSPFVPFGTRI